ncbi:MAG: SLBB domain-containing protein [Desulfosalsimonadaceae bacterium]
MKQLLVLTLLAAALFAAGFCTSHAAEGEYTVGDGDVLKIDVYENPDLCCTVRVSADDSIRVPLLGEVDVRDMAVSRVSQKLEEMLADGYLVSPQVDVFIEEYRSKNAIILGQVNRPGQYELRGPVTFLEFLSKAGGLTKDAGSTAIVKRLDPTQVGKDRIVLNLDQLIKEGDTSLNIQIRHGDNIFISKADTFYVTGEVKKPNAYQLEQGMTVIKAIARAEGFTDIAQKNKVRIIRETGGGKTVLENVDMNEKIMAGDVIVVPESFF